MDPARLTILRQKLVESREFAPVWDCFMTHFGERRDFMNLGKRVRSPVLEAAFTQGVEQVFGQGTPISNLFMIRLAEQQFIHGGLNVQGRFGNVFYFEEIGVGLLAIVLSFAGDNRLIRFTTRTAPGGEMALH